MADVIGLFPTPLMRVPGAVDGATVTALRERAVAAAQQENAHSARLSHTTMVDPAGDAQLGTLIGAVTPSIVEFGRLLFGEALRWTVKELWMNVLEPGGHQAIHAHANSFVSGIVYLSRSHPSAQTVFHKALGGTDFVFSNYNRNAGVSQFNGSKWVLPAVNPGDLVLYPSYLLHEVPVNRGDRRVTIAMNAIPDHLDSWGYRISFDK